MLAEKLISLLVDVLLLGPLAVSAWYSFRVLRFPDLAIEASFVLGAVVAVQVSRVLAGSMFVFAALPIAAIAGGIAAFCWALGLLSFLRAPKIVAAVVAFLALYSVNLVLLGIPNRPLPPEASLFALYSGSDRGVVLGLRLLLAATGVVAVWAAYSLYARTTPGLFVAGAASNPRAFQLTGRNDRTHLAVGLAASGAMAALSGAMSAHYVRYADINMGLGYLVLALGSVFFADLLGASARYRPVPLLALLGGVLVFKAASYLALELGTPPSLAKAVHALLLVVVLVAVRFTRGRGDQHMTGEFL